MDKKMKILINNFVKKNCVFFSVLVFSYLGVCGMEKSPEPSKVLESHITVLSNHACFGATESLKVDKGFGKQFDYNSFLKTDQDLSKEIYKRRLKFFKRYLFNFIDGYSRPLGADIENSGKIPAFLTSYLMAAAMLKESAQSIPALGNELVTNFLPVRAFKNSCDLIIPRKSIEGFQLSALPYRPDILYEDTRPMPKGNGIAPLIIDTDKTSYRIKALHMVTKDGAFVIMPHIHKTDHHKVIIKQTYPVYIISDPEAESISLALGQLNLERAPLETKILRALSFLDEENKLSQESKRILSCFVYNLSGEILDSLVLNKEQLKEQSKEEDKKAIQNCRINCPHILALELLQQRLLRCPRNFLNRDEKGGISFTPSSSNLFQEADKYLKAFSSLAPEYTTIYQRISTELKALKNKPLKSKSSSEIKKEDVQAIKVLENPVPAKIKYSKRVTKWFKDGFVKNKKQSSINYHATLPTIADPLVIKYGEKSEYDNKTHKGQKDENYTIAGKIIDDETKEESFCLFNVCIDPKGICYHRDCKKCTWEDLPVELKKGGAIEDVEYEEDSSGIDNETGSNPGTVRENNTYISISYPARKCTITLYKKLL